MAKRAVFVLESGAGLIDPFGGDVDLALDLTEAPPGGRSLWDDVCCSFRETTDG